MISSPKALSPATYSSGVGDVTLIVQWDVEVGADEYVAGLNAFGDEII